VRRLNPPTRLRDLWEDEGEEEFVLEMLKITPIAATVAPKDYLPY
jgi:hypothetical protein